MPELCLGSFYFEMVSRVVKIVSGVISGVIVLTIIIVIAIFASKNNSTESEQGFISTTAREDETRATSESSSSIAFNQSSTTFNFNARRLSTTVLTTDVEYLSTSVPVTRESTVEAGKKTFICITLTILL